MSRPALGAGVVLGPAPPSPERVYPMKQVVRFAAFALLATALGCGSYGRTTVKGKVTVGGKGPLTGGAIQFVLVADPNVSGGGQILADGTYEVINAPIGECKVLVDNAHLGGAKSTGPVAPTVGGGPSRPPADSGKKMSEPPKGVEALPGTAGTGGVKYIRIDPAYADKEKTPLKSTVSSGAASPSDFDVK